ncbi:hypothetical protein ACI77O_12455 [Pseudomonas tritici]|uniref:hypothetical protein n=1 Tax=Pseudomonas tritici TaxID=2745518 RepID=UPI00387B7367
MSTTAIVVLLLAGAVWLYVRANDPMKVFYRCLDEARAGDFEKSFMDRINSIAEYGDLLESTVRKWGVEGVTKAFHEVQSERTRQF